MDMIADSNFFVNDHQFIIIVSTYIVLFISVSLQYKCS